MLEREALANPPECEQVLSYRGFKSTLSISFLLRILSFGVTLKRRSTKSSVNFKRVTL